MFSFFTSLCQFSTENLLPLFKLFAEFCLVLLLCNDLRFLLLVQLGQLLVHIFQIRKLTNMIGQLLVQVVLCLLMLRLDPRLLGLCFLDDLFKVFLGILVLSDFVFFCLNVLAQHF